ncbi:hypothetical protein [Frankia sp. Cr2]|uniref:hypothetical protein n=1 Tax=Frankia sp. Cr2 TaxID=3073932 RepID=UPI002AD4B8EB|nr:hypothetical protein [Frankia sp. Cr2]
MSIHRWRSRGGSQSRAPTWYRDRSAVALLAVVALPAAAALALTGCGPSGGGPNGGVSSGHAGSTPRPGSVTSADATGTLPNLVGKGLQFAQDTAQAASFTTLTSHDALGRGRHQILDRDWQVCDQSPAAGTHPVSTKVDFGVVKLEESCPAAGSVPTTIPSIGTTMPNLTGRSLNAVRPAFGSNASITLHDATGGHRPVVVESNWKICSTSPAAGKPYSLGTPVTFNVVKVEETCP